jgi:hypothetical protein
MNLSSGEGTTVLIYNRKKNIVKAIRLCLKGIDVRNLSYENKIRLAVQVRDILIKFKISESFTIISNELIVKT